MNPEKFDPSEHESTKQRVMSEMREEDIERAIAAGNKFEDIEKTKLEWGDNNAYKDIDGPFGTLILPSGDRLYFAENDPWKMQKGEVVGTHMMLNGVNVTDFELARRLWDKYQPVMEILIGDGAVRPDGYFPGTYDWMAGNRISRKEYLKEAVAAEDRMIQEQIEKRALELLGN